MLTIHLRFYEELNEFLPNEKRKVRFTHTIPVQTSVKDLIESYNIPHTQVTMIIVNDEQENFSYLVRDKDDISVFPFFHAFDIHSVSKIHSPIQDVPQFIVDQHLGTLARYLRMCGIDTLFADLTGNELVENCNNEKRILLTKDHNILKRNDLIFGYFIYACEPDKQLDEVILQFRLQNMIEFLTRCIECNTLLTPIKKSGIEDRIPEKVKELHDSFTYCEHCDKIYWKGTHYQKMRRKIENILNHRGH